MHTNVVQEQNSVAQIPTQVKSSKFDDYQRDLNKAISLFKKGEYGSAYVSFNNIDATYTDNVKQGLPEYWIARSWYRLREFQSAKKYFQSFVRKYPTSIQAPMAKYYLAKIDVSMGMPGSAISLLQEVIREHPNGNAADASRKLIGEMNNAL
jgi:outer membrane protein assembly factor BamD